MLVCGPTGSGKTQFVLRLITEQMFEPVPERIMWIYGEWQPLYDILKIKIPDIEFKNGIPADLYDSITADTRNLVILDDQMSEAGDKKELSQLFTQGSHHRNLSVIYIVQNLFDQGRSMRTVSLNTQDLVIFKNPRDKKQITTLASQMYPKNGSFLTDAYLDATTEPFGYLVIDLKQDTPEEFRVRSKIFLGESTVVYQPTGYKRK